MERDRWWLVAGAGLAVFMAMLDMSVVNVALPAIGEDLHTDPSVTQWVVLGYLLPLVALALPSGRWLDKVGRRAALACSAAGFAAASAAAGLAPGIGWLVAARVAQGMFGAVLFALTPALATVAVRPQARGRAMGVVTTLGPIGGVSGPPLGGFLVETVGWQWIFYINLPVSLAVIALGVTQLPADGSLRLPDRTWAAEAVLLAGAAVALMLGLSLAAGQGLGWLALVLAAAPLLAAWYRLPTSKVVRELLRAPAVAGPHLALLLTSAATGMVVFLTPFYLQRVLHASASVTGLAILAFPLAMAALGPAGGMLADRWSARRTAVAGAAGVTGGLLLAVPLGAVWTPTDLAWRLAVIGAGGGLFQAPNMTMAMASAPRGLLATTGATTSLARQLGFSLGPALATATWALTGYTLDGMRAALGLAAVLAALGALTLARTRPAGHPAGHPPWTGQPAVVPQPPISRRSHMSGGSRP